MGLGLQVPKRPIHTSSLPLPGQLVLALQVVIKTIDIVVSIVTIIHNLNIIVKIFNSFSQFDIIVAV